MYLKYASIPLAIGAYDETGPLNGNVPPIVIDLLVTPGVASVVVPESVRANAPGSATLSAAPRATIANMTFFIKSPP